jgi:AhpD family alkylhydroperoxidase
MIGEVVAWRLDPENSVKIVWLVYLIKFERMFYQLKKSLYQQENLVHLNQLKDLVPGLLHAYSEYSSTVLSEGTLSRKEKVIIAVAIAHVMRCPYSIDIHTRSAKAEGVSLEELVEGVFVGAGVEAGGAITHSTHFQHAIDEESGDELYRRSNLKEITNLKKWAQPSFKAYSDFSETVMKKGQLTSKFKEIIAVATAHATQCPYCIDVHSKKAVKNGATKEELSEAILLTSALLAGGTYTHMTNMIKTYAE